MSLYYELNGKPDRDFVFDPYRLKPRGQKLRDLISGLMDDMNRMEEIGPKQYRAISNLGEVALEIATECINATYGKY